MSKTLDNSMIDMAWVIANKAHAGQGYERAKCTWEYITHIKRVVHNLGDVPIEVKIVGILHDVVEDSDMTGTEVTILFGYKVGQAVHQLSERENEPYNAYIERCATNPIAKMVKSVDIADHILHCVRPDRTHDWETLLQRYIKGMAVLHSIRP